MVIGNGVVIWPEILKDFGIRRFKKIYKGSYKTSPDGPDLAAIGRDYPYTAFEVQKGACWNSNEREYSAESFNHKRRGIVPELLNSVNLWDTGSRDQDLDKGPFRGGRSDRIFKDLSLSSSINLFPQNW